MHDQLGLEIRIRDHFQIYFHTMNPMIASELANKLSLKIVLFEIALLSRCV